MFDAGKLKFGRVVGYHWIVVVGSWGRSRLVDRYSRLWRYVGLTKGVSIRLLARTWARCCSGRTVHNSESLPGLRCTLQERRGRGKARALPGPLAVRTYRTGAKALPCQSRADESDGSEGFVVSKPCGRIGRERRLCRAKAVRSMAMARFAPKPCGRADGSEGFAVPKPCGRWLWPGSRQSRADERTGAKALSCQSRADERTGAKALSCQSRADERRGQEAKAKMGVILALRR